VSVNAHIDRVVVPVAEVPVPLVAQIPPPPFSVIELGPLSVHLYGVIIGAGALLALFLVVKRYEAGGGDGEIAEKASLMALLGGFLGARIGYVIPRFLGEGGFVERPLDILAIWQGGLAFFGGLLGGALAVILYVRAKQGDLALMADAMAPAAPLAQAIGRWGNYFNQELYGRPTDLPWALQVEPAFRRPGFEDETTFHPTFLYESLWNLALVAVILVLERLRVFRRRGSLVFVYLIGYGLGRGWVEFLRIDTVERYLFDLSRNNWIAIGVVLLGVVGLVWYERGGDGGPDEEGEPGDEGGRSHTDEEADRTDPGDPDR
jgi:prolipoprotein diacylglyceryl transferase